MAKKEDKPKVVVEREYNVPLRREFNKVPRWKKTQKASKGLRNFLVKHMKPEGMEKTNVKIGKYLNEELWKHGIKNPPHHVKIIAKKDDKGIVRAELVGAPVEKTTKDKMIEGQKEDKKPKEEKKNKEKKPEVKETVKEKTKETPAKEEKKPAEEVKESLPAKK